VEKQWLEGRDAAGGLKSRAGIMMLYEKADESLRTPKYAVHRVMVIVYRGTLNVIMQH
jgi:hypothetical protein